jgi:hypothetical protein
MKFHSDGFRTEHKQRSTSGVEIGSRLDEEAAAEMEIEASGSQSLLRKVSAEWWTGEEYILSATAAGTKGEAARRSRPQDTVHNCRSVMELEDQVSTDANCVFCELLFKELASFLKLAISVQ